MTVSLQGTVDHPRSAGEASYRATVAVDRFASGPCHWSLDRVLYHPGASRIPGSGPPCCAWNDTPLTAARGGHLMVTTTMRSDSVVWVAQKAEARVYDSDRVFYGVRLRRCVCRSDHRQTAYGRPRLASAAAPVARSGLTKSCGVFYAAQFSTYEYEPATAASASVELASRFSAPITSRPRVRAHDVTTRSRQWHYGCLARKLTE